MASKAGFDTTLIRGAHCYSTTSDTVGMDADAVAYCETVTSHGTQVTQSLLHIAPKVSLYISNPLTIKQLRKSVDWMKNQGVQVINHSGGWPWDGPGDGTSTDLNSPLKSVDTAVEDSIIWVNAAGNEARKTWYSASPTWTSSSKLAFNSAGDTCNTVSLGSVASFQLRWKGNRDSTSWGNANIDLDLYLLNSAGTDTVHFSNELQSGDDDHNPYETIDSYSSGSHCLMVVKASSTDPAWVQLQAFWGTGDLAYYTERGSIANPAESKNAGMLAVGAAHYSSHTIEPFSSRGPTPDGLRIKPDIVGADGYKFPAWSDSLGTSYGSPHVAGLAALVIDRYENDANYDTPTEIAKYLKRNAQDMGSPVPNNTWGHGFAELPALPTATLVLSPALISENGGVTTVTATLDSTATTATTITVSAAAVSPAASGDFTLSSATTLTIAANATTSTGTVTITATDNAVRAATKSVKVSGTVTGVVPPDTLTLMITDDDTPQVTLALAPSSISENGGVSTVTATLDRTASAAATITVSAAAVPPAVVGDFTLSTATTLTIAANATTSTGLVTIAAVNDTTVALDKSVTVSGTVTGGDNAKDPSALTLTIIDDDDPVTIPDDSLRAVILASLRKSAGYTITNADMLGLTLLNAASKDISDLTGLESATNLTYLFFSTNNVTDIAPLSRLTSLTHLDLNGNNIAAIDSLSGLTNLERLYFNGNNIADIAPLSGLTNLTGLGLDSNNVTDIAPLSGLTNLTGLGLNGNNIADIAPLSGLDSLENLYLNDNNVADISHLSGLTRLTRLGLDGNNISNLEPLVDNMGLGNEDHVEVRGNPLSATSRTSYIPTLKGKGVTVYFDQLSMARLVKVSGDEQIGTASAALADSFVVKVRSADDTTYAYRNLPVTFSVAAGGGRLSATSDTTDANGLARTRLTLGATVGMDTVKAFLEGVRGDTLIFTAMQSVTIPDDSLRTVILDSLGKSGGDTTITNANMLSLTRLEAPDKGITNLTGLEYATNLDTLDLGHNHGRHDPRRYINSNNITDIGALSGLTRLKDLSLERNAISDLSPLRNLTSLKSLDLRINKFSDISVLSHLTNLTVLALAYNSITNISPLSSLINLTFLDFRGGGGTRITDISALRGLTKLTHLGLGGDGNSISDISSLSGLTKLTYLDLGGDGNSISDISSLSGLTKLTHLGLGGDGNRISDISALRGLTNLEGLFLSGQGNSISNISSLSGLTKLTYLGLGGDSNRISDISALRGLTNLEGLFLNGQGNSISNISSLSGLTKLTTLNLAWNSIIDLSSLSGLDSLKTLQLDHNRISNLSPLVSNTGLGSGDYVDVRGNPLSALARGTHIPTLTDTSRGVTVAFDSLSVARLVKVSGDGQIGTASTALANPFVVKVQSANDTTYAYGHLPVTFSVAAGGGRLSATSDTTDYNGLARTRLTLGTTVGMDTVKAFVEGASDTLIFTTLSPRPVTIADDSLRAVILDSLDKTNTDTIRVSDMLRLTRLNAPNKGISNLAGLEFATQLDTLDLGNNRISNIDSLAGLTRLKKLSLGGNRIADIDSLARLTDLTRLGLSNNRISDLSPLTSNTGLGNEDHVEVRGNPLSAASRTSYIPTLTGRGVRVSFDSLSVARLVKISGDRQTGTASAALANPFVVKVRSANDTTYAYRNLPVTFSVAAGGGRLSTTSDTTDSGGLAQTLLTLGATVGMDTVKAFVEGASDSDTLIFTTVPRFVTIPDANLRALILDSLGKSAGDTTAITNADMLRLTQLIASYKGISNLTGLEYATNLTKLNLYFSNVADLSPLSGLTSLRTLHLQNNNISDLSPLSGLTSLTSLGLAGNNITAIDSLSSLTSLQALWLHQNNISDIAPLSGLTRLIGLWLTQNNISDLSHLSGLTSLRTLYLDGNNISAISHLSGLTRLITLHLEGNNISDLSHLSGLTSLRTLHLGRNNISDLSHLSGLTSLTSLGLASNNISDLSHLSGLTSLQALWLIDNNISAISHLSGLTRLRTLHLRDNNISAISHLSGLTSLTRLGLQGNNISAISHLSGLTRLLWLNLASNNISDISGLTNLTQLSEVYLGDNRISDILPLVSNSGLGSGDRVDVRGNPLSAASRTTHIPTFTSRGVTVWFDPLSVASLVKVSGDGQTGTARTALKDSFVVKVQSANDTTYAYRNLPVTFSVAAGGGSLSAPSDTTDYNGLARTRLTLGTTVGMDTVKAFVEGASDTLIFTTLSPQPTPDFDGNGQVNFADFLALANKMGSSRDRGAYEAKYDLDGDGEIGMSDFRILTARFGDGKFDERR